MPLHHIPQPPAADEQINAIVREAARFTLDMSIELWRMVAATQQQAGAR